MAPAPAPPRWWLTTLACLGSASYQFIVLAPLAMLLAVQSLWFPLPWANTVVVVILVGAWWLTQGQDPPPGSELSREEAPGLWVMLDDLADQMRVPRLQRVVLVAGRTAAAIEHQDHWLPWRHHRTLVLGVPLLAGLSAEEMQAVLAHELGHFSRHFGVTGHWLYRARLGWSRLLVSHRQDAVWYRAAAAFARWFVPMFERLTAVQAVHDEYEADALAARATSAPALGRALTKLAAAGAMDTEAFGAGPLPADPLGQSGAGLRGAVDQAALEQRLRDEAAWHARQDPAVVTHPATLDRLRAVGLVADNLRLNGLAPSDAAGPAWWGPEAWATRLAQENAHWCTAHARAWRAEAAWRTACTGRLQSATPLALWEEQECRLSLDETLPCPDAKTPSDSAAPLALYWQGLAWLGHDTAAAGRWLEAAIQRCVALAGPARARLATHESVRSDPAALERQQSLLVAAQRRRGDARWRAEALGPAAGHAVEADGWREAALRSALADDEAVLRAQWVQHDITLTSGRQYSVVTLCLQVDLARRVTEEQLRDDYTNLLARVITPARVGRVRSWWDTETWPAALAKQAEQAPWSVLKARPTAIAAPAPV